MAPGARIVSLKVAGSDGETSLAQVLGALNWVRENRTANGLNIRVVNLALGVEDRGGYKRDVLAWAVEQLWREGIVVVAAAGNNGAYADRLDIPAADPFVIAAGASDTRDTVTPADDRVADFSSRSRFRSPDVVAPGAKVVSLRVPGSALDREYPGARVGGAYFRGSGTSQASAVVSGLVARLLSDKPELVPDQVKALLMAGAVDLPDPREADGAGRVDLKRTLAAPVPDAASVRQGWEPAVLDRRALARALHDNDEYATGGAEWSGRRWSAGAGPVVAGLELRGSTAWSADPGHTRRTDRRDGRRGVRVVAPGGAGSRALRGRGAGPRGGRWRPASPRPSCSSIHAHVRGSAHSRCRCRSCRWCSACCWPRRAI